MAPTDTKDYYKSLGVSRQSSDQEIQQAYRKLALKYHPDKNPGDAKAEARFKEISEAYEVLSDPEKKKMYDLRGADGLKDMGYEGFASTDDIFAHFGDLFSDLFGGSERGGGFAGQDQFGRRRFQQRVAPPQRGQDIRHRVSISFEEAALGTSRELRTGVSDGQTLSVKIPAAVDDGAVLRLSDQGQLGTNGGPRGDLLLEIQINTHPEFGRDGLDIRSTATVPVKTALLGGSVDVRTLHGTIALKIPPLTSSDALLRLRGQGVKTARGQGDHLVRVAISMPTEIPDDLKKALKGLPE